MNIQKMAACVAQVNANLAEAGPLMSEAATMIERQHDVITRLVSMIDDVRDNTEGHWPQLDSGCIECTQGATPNRYNTGPCAYHDAVRLLAGKKDERKSIHATLRFQCLVQAQTLQGRVESFPDMPPGIKVLLEQTAKVLMEVAK